MKPFQRTPQELMHYVATFKDESATEASSHPAHMVMDQLAGPCEENNRLHAAQLEQWYMDYSTMQGMPHLFKKEVDAVR